MPNDPAPFNAPQIVDPTGKPARKASDTACPKCGAGKDKRVASSGFGEPHPVCSRCGHEFYGERTL
jgi:uncharacterized protein (DUF983 family)